MFKTISSKTFLCLTTAALAAAAPAAASAVDPPFAATAAALYAESQGRGADQLANPDYAQRFAPLFEEYAASGGSDLFRVTTDPYRLDWAPARGEEVRVEFENRYGATLKGRLWLPKRPTRRRLPTVLFVNGGGAGDSSYLGFAQGLAEAGYLVMTFDPQGAGRSDVEPAEGFCDPDGTWREPQEFGLREHGECAGFPPDDPRREQGFDDTPLEGSVAAYWRYVVEMYATGSDWDELASFYEQSGVNQVFGALDATDWLLSRANPQRKRVDGRRLAIIGHSLGAWAALVVGNGDERFDAAVALDGYGRLPATVAPRVPTMLQHAELQESGPYKTPPDVDPPVGGSTFANFRSSGIDTALISLRGSTHQDFAYIPYQAINPFIAPYGNASRLGERVSLYYTKSWFDRYLKGRRRASRRLLAREFDGSVDGSSIGAGRWSAEKQANIPYELAGKKVSRRLSPIFRSAIAFDGHRCNDWREGCE